MRDEILRPRRWKPCKRRRKSRRMIRTVLVDMAELQFDFNKVKEAEATVDKVL